MLQGILLFLPIGRWGGGPAEGWWRGMGRDLRISPPPPPSAAVPLPLHAWGGIGRGRGNSVPRPLPFAIESSGQARAGHARCAEGADRPRPRDSGAAHLPPDIGRAAVRESSG